MYFSIFCAMEVFMNRRTACPVKDRQYGHPSVSKVKY